jgi:hypothetical protein
MAKKRKYTRKAKITVNVGDPVDHPSHYNQAGIETIQVVDILADSYRNGSVGAAVGTALTYLWRAPFKGRLIEDLKKAAWWLNHAIERAELLKAQ